MKNFFLPLPLLRYRDGQLLPTDRNNNDNKYEGGNPDQPSLIIRSVGKEDIGIYSCVLENDAGIGESRKAATVDVQCKDRPGIWVCIYTICKHFQTSPACPCEWSLLPP